MNMPYRPGAPLRLSYRDYKLALLAGVPQELRVAGNYWQVISTAAGAPVMLAFDESAAIQRNAGTGGPATYSAVRVSSAVDQLVTISLGQLAGPAPYDRGDMTFAGTINVAASVPTVNASLPDVAVAATTLTLLSAADPTRRTFTIKLPTTAAGPVRIGDSAIGAARGLLLEEGETAVIAGTSAVYVYNPNAVAVTVTMMEARIP